MILQYDSTRVLPVTWNLRPAGDPCGDPSPAIDDSKTYPGDVWLCFRHNFIFKHYHQDLKNSPERRVTRFPTICAKNQALNFDEVMTF
jgi:hypothetical protein